MKRFDPVIAYMLLGISCFLGGFGALFLLMEPRWLLYVGLIGQLIFFTLGGCAAIAEVRAARRHQKDTP